MTFNYRFSVIPAGAITDARLSPRALQVLCLLGRHTNDAGWCSRSQVKMAKELTCGRSTVYDALELLVGCGWVEKRRNGRGSTPAEASEQPFAAYSYRVLLDRETLPERLEMAAESADERGQDAPDSQGQEGAALAAGGAGIAAGGAAPEPAPLEGSSSEGISSEPERERARAREKRATGLATFEARWPTAAADDRNRTQYAWEALSQDEREEALTNIGPFLEHLKAVKRQAVPAGWKYLEQRRWKLLAQARQQGAPSPLRPVPESSPEGRAWINIHRVGRAMPFIASGQIVVPEMTPQYLAFADLPPESAWGFIDIEESRHQAGAWSEFITTSLRGRNRAPLVQERDGKRGFFAPWPWPPRKDGSLSSTDPPECADGELRDFK